MSPLNRATPLILAGFFWASVAIGGQSFSRKRPENVTEEGINLQEIDPLSSTRHKLPTPTIISEAGYPVEIHVVVTEDCYILEMHRIPYGKKSPPETGVKRPVVLVQHCLLCSSADFVLIDPEKAFAFKLADAGYDVWLGNFRGNTYSRKHCHLDPNHYDFWRFSWNEMGRYDLPAMLKEVMESTATERIFYVGHSMGTTAYMVFANEYPEMQEHIILSSLMAPIAHVEHMKSPIRLLAPVAHGIGWIMEALGIGEFLPNSMLMDFLATLFCKEEGAPLVCSSILFLVCGWDTSQMDPSLLQTIFHHTPAGASTATILHYAQGVVTGEFRKYDFGLKENNAIYGQAVPPSYDLGKLTAPVAAYWGDNDWLASIEDVEKFTSGIPNLVASYEVPYHTWNHLDFLYGIDADTLVYNEVLSNMEAYRRNITNSAYLKAK